MRPGKNHPLRAFRVAKIPVPRKDTEKERRERDRKIDEFLKSKKITKLPPAYAHFE